jgi:uncharacterized protein (DUF2336 family)
MQLARNPALTDLLLRRVVERRGLARLRAVLPPRGKPR